MVRVLVLYEVLNPLKFFSVFYVTQISIVIWPDKRSTLHRLSTFVINLKNYIFLPVEQRSWNRVFWGLTVSPYCFLFNLKASFWGLKSPCIETIVGPPPTIPHPPTHPHPRIITKQAITSLQGMAEEVYKTYLK